MQFFYDNIDMAIAKALYTGNYEQNPLKEILQGMQQTQRN